MSHIFGKGHDTDLNENNVNQLGIQCTIRHPIPMTTKTCSVAYVAYVSHNAFECSYSSGTRGLRQVRHLRRFCVHPGSNWFQPFLRSRIGKEKLNRVKNL